MRQDLHTLFVPAGVLAEPLVRWALLIVGALLVVAWILTALLRRSGRLSPAAAGDIAARTRSWLVIAPAIGIPILLGPGWIMCAVTLLALASWREFARATGAFRDRYVSAAVVLVILVAGLASLDHWPRLFLAAGPLGSALVALAALAGAAASGPERFVQRTALGVFGVAFFAMGLGALGMLANDAQGRSVVLLVILVTQIGDVAAFVTGRAFGRRALCPKLSPRKTVAGAAGGLAAGVILMTALGPLVFTEGPLSSRVALAAAGLLLALLGQLGDLMLSAVKRDIGVKDLGALFPGHGGLLDRFDSLVLAAPAWYHLVSYLQGVGAGTAIGRFSGAGAGG